MNKKLLLLLSSMIIISSSLIHGMKKISSQVKQYRIKKSWQYKFNEACKENDLGKIYSIAGKHLAACKKMKKGKLQGIYEEEVYMPLHIAVFCGNTSIVEFLINSDFIDKDAKDSENNAPIHNAAFEGEWEIVKLLIEKYKIDPTIRGAKNYTLGHCAVMNNHLSVVQYLVEDVNIDLCAVDKYKKTAWERAYPNKKKILYYITKQVLKREINSKTGLLTCPICFEEKKKSVMTVTDYGCLQVICKKCKLESCKNAKCPKCDRKLQRIIA